MRLILGIVLLVYLVVSTHLIELVRLPMLYTHYLEHKKTDRSLSFASFISMHYDASRGHTDSKHSNLPFKSNLGNIGVSIPWPLNTILNATIQKPIALHGLIVFLYSSQYDFHYLTAIWQPPKI